MEKIECQLCEGTGGSFYSCCGDDISDNDIDLCPTCYEHCGEGDLEECEHCNGLGHVFESDKIEEIEEEARRITKLENKHEEDIKHYRIKGDIHVGTSPPKQSWPSRVYYNTIDGRLWQLRGSSWVPMENQNDMTKLRKSYLVTYRPEYAEAQAMMEREVNLKVRDGQPPIRSMTGRIPSGDINPCSEIPPMRMVNPITIEQAVFMKEQEDRMMYGNMPPSTTKVYHINWKSMEKQTGIKFINVDDNGETSKNNNEPIHDHSIFDSR